MNFFPFGVALFVILIPIVWIIISILLCIWVYKDAEARGESAVLWLIVVLITGIIGLIVWLVVRPDKKASTREPRREGVRYCPNCGSEVLKGDKFCGECGEKLE